MLSNRINQAIATLRAAVRIGVTEWRAIAVLGRYPDLSAGEVAARTAMDKVAVSRAVARLLERGLVQRDTHGDDRRRSVLALSRSGQRIYDEIAPLALDWSSACCHDWIATSAAALDALLDKLAGGVAHLADEAD